jgi:hypothetical protein
MDTNLLSLMANLPPNLRFKIRGIVETDNLNTKASERVLMPVAPPKLFTDEFDESKLRLISKADLHQIETHGWCMINNFLGARTLHRIRIAMESCLQNGLLKSTEMKSSDGQVWHTSEARGDLAMWLHTNDEQDAATIPFEVLDVVRILDSLRLELNEAAGFQSPRHQVQLACYPGKNIILLIFNHLVIISFIHSRRNSML